MHSLAVRRPYIFVAVFLCGSVLMQLDASPAEEPAKPALKQVSQYDRPAKMPHQSRSATVASHGIVAASVPLAAQVGLDILKAGGTAADAAIATDAMLGLTEPMSCGIGGDLFCIYWDNKTQKLYGLNASGRSPYALNRDVFKQRGLKSIPGEGILSWSVPGCVDGGDQLRSRFGTMKLSQLLAPAIQYADEGFPVSEIIAGFWKSGERIAARYPDAAATYYPNGRAPRMGELFKNPNLAASLRAIAEGGRDAFYRGEIAPAIVDIAQSPGGYFSMKDFEDHTSPRGSTRSRPITAATTSGNCRRTARGSPCSRCSTCSSRTTSRPWAAQSAEALHLMIEAKKLAYEDRAKYYADPAFAKRAGRAADLQAVRRRAGARGSNRDRANDHGRPRASRGRADTIYMTVVDKDFNAVSLIQSNFHGFGSYHVPGDLGFALQNRGCLFALDPHHANRLEPRKRPFHTIIPASSPRAASRG